MATKRSWKNFHHKLQEKEKAYNGWLIHLNINSQAAIKNGCTYGYKYCVHLNVQKTAHSVEACYTGRLLPHFNLTMWVLPHVNLTMYNYIDTHARGDCMLQCMLCYTHQVWLVVTMHVVLHTPGVTARYNACCDTYTRCDWLLQCMLCYTYQMWLVVTMYIVLHTPGVTGYYNSCCVTYTKCDWLLLFMLCYTHQGWLHVTTHATLHTPDVTVHVIMRVIFHTPDVFVHTKCDCMLQCMLRYTHHVGLSMLLRTWCYVTHIEDTALLNATNYNWV